MKTLMKPLLIMVLTFLLSDGLIFCQEIPCRIQRINGRITLDGLSNESAWAGITAFNPVMQRPVFGNNPTELTDIFVAYDDDYLYVAGRLYDTEPDKIQITTLKRDNANQSSEWFGIVLDTYNDKENAVAFFTTPSGLRLDCSIVEGPGGISFNTNWNTFWDVAATKNNEGWFAEFKIPLSSLRFKMTDGKVIMGMISWRLIPRKNEWDIFPSIPDSWSMSFFKISLAQEVVFEGIERKKPVYIAPYILAGWEEKNKLNFEGTSYKKDPFNKFEAGVDVKYGITNNLTLDATINTDFSQVEIDDQVISLERYSVYMPEKRQFFLERTRNFDFTFNNQNSVFYSRKIGINIDKPVRIYGGGRLVGRIGKTDIGFLNMQTAPLDSFMSENMGVLRLKRQVFNETSYVGGISTTKIGTDGSYNIVYGLDGLFKIKGDDYLKMAFVQNVDSKVSRNAFSTDALRYRIELERRSIDKFSYLFGTSYIGRNYNPALGFENWQNYSDVNGKLQYSWLGKESAAIYRTTAGITPVVMWNNSDGKIDGWNISPSLFFIANSGYEFTISGNLIYEKVRYPLTYLNKVDIPLGNYRFYNAGIQINTPFVNPFQISFNFSTGTFYDGTRVSFIVQPRWNVSRYVEFETRYQFDRINIADRNLNTVSHLLRLKTQVMFNTKLSLAAFVQYCNVEKLCFSNARFRYNPKEGMDLYIVYSHGFNAERHETEPVMPVTNSRNISIKYVHTFIL
jgi:hypothetical protein